MFSRRKLLGLIGCGSAAVATGVLPSGAKAGEQLSGMITKSPMMFTPYEIQSDGPWPWKEIGTILHREDMSDLAEPYLSAVKRSRAAANSPIPERS